MEMVARTYLVYEITDSPAMLGVISMSGAIPMLVLSLFGGAIADRFPKKSLIQLSQIGMTIIFLAYAVGQEGRVYTYEKRRDFYEKVVGNVERCGVGEIVEVKNDEVKNCEEHNVDLITLDMKGAEEIIREVKECIKPGGWLVAYSPHIEQQIKVRQEMEKEGFGFIRTIETMQREWKSLGGYTHPKPKGITHTGFMTFGRKIT